MKEAKAVGRKVKRARVKGVPAGDRRCCGVVGEILHGGRELLRRESLLGVGMGGR